MVRFFVAVVGLAALAACDATNNPLRDPALDEAVVGAAIGGVAGAGVSADGDRGQGAALGASTGALAGALISRNREGRCIYRNTRTGERYQAACPRN